MIVVGNNGCVHCEMTKRMLNQKGITYQYILFDNLSETEQTHYMNLAKENGLMNFPLIIKEDKIINIKDV